MFGCAQVGEVGITAGGELVFTMSSQPNTDWGKAATARPYTQTAY